jgi:acetyltransferase-like isoleucine patch superfamily enzyme
VGVAARLKSAWRVGLFASAAAAVRHLASVTLNPRVRAEGFLHLQAGARLIVEPGGRLEAGRGVLIKNDAVVYVKRGARLVLGDRFALGHHGEISVNERVEIGADTFTAPYCYVTDSNHRYDDPAVPIRRQPMDVHPTVIGRDVWLGRGSMVLAGASVPDGCVVGAGAIVTKAHAPGDVIVGAPGRTVKNRHASGAS